MIPYFLHQKQYREKMGTTTNSTPDIISNEKEALKTYRLHVGEKKKSVLFILGEFSLKF